MLVVCNFTPVPRYNYRIGVPDTRQWREIFNSDAKGFGGSDVGNAGPLTPEEIYSHGMTASIELTLPPLATIILRQES